MSTALKFAVTLLCLLVTASTAHSRATKKTPIQLCLQAAGAVVEAPHWLDFDAKKIKRDYRKAVATLSKVVDRVVKNEQAPTFENTILPVEKSIEVAEVLLRTAEMIGLDLENNLGETFFDQKYFDKVKLVFDSRKKSRLSQLQVRLVEDYYRRFLENGTHLTFEEREAIDHINGELEDLSAKFQENLFSSVRAFVHYTLEPEDLAGLSAGTVAAARRAAQKKGKEGYLLGWSFDLYSEVLNNAKRAALREAYYRARYRLGMGEPSNDNREVALKIATLRRMRAQLLGFENHSQTEMEESLAEFPKKMSDRLKASAEPVKQLADQVINLIKKFKEEKMGNADLLPWDVDYWLSRYNEAKLDRASAALNPYFEMNTVLEDGVFWLAKQMWNLDVKERKDLPAPAPSVRVFEVSENGQVRAVVYLDPFPRSEEDIQAMQVSVRQRSASQGVAISHVKLLNLRPKSEGDPVLLDPGQVAALFHEMGHAFHTVLSDVPYASIGGENVPTNVVEVPSLWFESFAFHPDVLGRYGRHYKTRKQIPEDLLRQWRVRLGFARVRGALTSIQDGLLDLAWHGSQKFPSVKGVVEFEQGVLLGTDLLPNPENWEGTDTTSSLLIFSEDGEYGGVAYAYALGAMAAADLWNLFGEDSSLTDRNLRRVGTRIRNSLLSQGNARPWPEMFNDLTGRSFPDGINYIQSLARP